MSTSELECRLGDVLQRHAEDAMNSTNTEEELERLLDDTGRSARRRHRAWIAGGLVVAAAVIVWRPDLGSDKADPNRWTRNNGPSRPGGFVEAFADFDPDRAATYLASGADLTIWTDQLGNDHWRRGNRWLQAAGTQIRLDSCDALWTSGPGTHVSCVLDLEGLGSEQLGRGPYPDNTFTLTINDGEIVDASMELASGRTASTRRCGGPSRMGGPDPPGRRRGDVRRLPEVGPGLRHCPVDGAVAAARRGLRPGEGAVLLLSRGAVA